MAVEKEVRISCPKCSAKLLWRPEYAGRVAKCKSCSAKLRMPKSAPDSSQKSRQRSNKQAVAAAKRRDKSAVEDPFAFLDDGEAEQAPRSAGRRSGGGKRRRGPSNAGGASVKCPGCGANCAPTESTCPVCDHSLADEVLAAEQSKRKSQKPKKKRKEKGPSVLETEIVGLSLTKWMIIGVCLVIAGVIAYPMIVKLRASNQPQPYYKIVKLGGSNRIEVFDENEKFINALYFRSEGIVLQNGGTDHGPTGEVIEDGFGGPVFKATLTGYDDKDYIVEYTGAGINVRVRSMTFDGKRVRQKYDNGQFAP